MIAWENKTYDMTTREPSDLGTRLKDIRKAKGWEIADVARMTRLEMDLTLHLTEDISVPKILAPRA